MSTGEIVEKLWNLCHVLRDDGITYHEYITELTYLLFLKMAKETRTDETQLLNALRAFRALGIEVGWRSLRVDGGGFFGWATSRLS